MRDLLAAITARALLDAGAFLIRSEQPFRLTSGLLAPFYVNCRQILGHPMARRQIADALAETIRGLEARTALEIIAGGVTAGVPYATMAADRLGLPLVYIRPEPKGHGLGGQIEGGEVKGRQVLLIEDLITTAGSILKFAGVLRDAGANLRDVVVVFSRANAEAAGLLKQAGLNLHALCDLERLLAEGRAAGLIKDAALTQVRAFLADPKAWSAAHAAPI
jgi:orotate phosphoribosyltransferase